MGFLGKLFSDNQGVSKDFVELVRAKDNGEEWANIELRRLWESGAEALIPKIHKAWLIIYSEAAEQGDKDAILKVAKALASANPKKSVELYMKLIDQKDTDAMKALAFEYSGYGGFTEDKEREFNWYFAAAKLGDAEAQYSVAREYLLKSDFENAFDWYLKSAEQEFPEGEIGLAEMYINMPFYKGLSENDISQEERNRQLWLAEDLLIHALNNAQSDRVISEAMEKLGEVYSYLRPPLPRRAAYFYYNAYLCDTDFEFLFEKVKSLNQNYALGITKELLDFWKENPYDEENE